MVDLIQNVFKDKAFKFHQMYMENGTRKIAQINSSDFADKKIMG